MTVPITVLIPTIGRAALLDACLRSIAAGTRLPAETIVVDQSGDQAVRDVVAAHRDARARYVRCQGSGYARGLNVGLRDARNAAVLVTNDDCTVAPDWVGVAWSHVQRRPSGIVTGQVLPGGGDVSAVPSTIVDPTPRDYTGQVVTGVLYGGNMVLPRELVLDLGGFDERTTMRVAAEDNDLCYRWTSGGRPLAYAPDLVVWHHDWRTPDQLYERYIEYGRGQGAFYAKHLRRGDRRILRFIGRDLRDGVRAHLSGLRHRTAKWSDYRRGYLRGLLPGLAAGWAEERRMARGGGGHDQSWETQR